MEFKMGDASEELLRVATDGKVHAAGKVFAGWDGYVRYVARLEASAKEVCEYFEADYHIPVEVKKLMEILSGNS